MTDERKNILVDGVLGLIGHTPLIHLKRIADPSKMASIYGKLEAFNPGGSIKDRACLFMLEDAEKKGLLTKNSTIIEPTSGNTGIGLAMICAVKGYRCILTMPENLSLERTYMLRNYGAEVVLTPARLGMQGAIERAEQLAKKIKDSFIPRQFKSEANPKAHRETTAVEIMDVLGKDIDAFVAGVGTGGTITGVGEVLKKEISRVKVIAVEPARSAVLSGKRPGRHNIQGIGAGFVPDILNKEVIDDIITVEDSDAYAMARRLGKEEGLCVGISSGANVLAALQLAEKLGPGKRIVTILCDTGERYFSMEQFFEA